MWRFSVIAAGLILCGGCEKQVVAEAEAEPATPASATVPTGNIQKHHTVKGENWYIESKYLDVSAAEAEANEQLDAGNCRLIGEFGYSTQISSDTNIPNMVALILVTDTGDVIDDRTARGLAKARAFGEIYNKIIEAECDFTPAFKYVEERERRRIEVNQRPAK